MAVLYLCIISNKRDKYVHGCEFIQPYRLYPIDRVHINSYVRLKVKTTRNVHFNWKYRNVRSDNIKIIEIDGKRKKKKEKENKTYWLLTKKNMCQMGLFYVCSTQHNNMKIVVFIFSLNYCSCLLLTTL